MSKTIKYIFTLILFIIAFFMIGMQSLNHFQTFQNQFAKTKIQLPAMNQRADFLKQIITCAERYKISVFTETSEPVSPNQELLTIFCTNGAEEQIANQCDIRAGTYSSFMSETTEVVFSTFSYLPEYATVMTVSLIGDWSSVCQFCTELNQYYETESPEKGEPDSDQPLFCIIWIVVYMILIMFTVFEICAFEKEKTLLVAHGGNTLLLILKKILTDILILSLMFVLAGLSASALCNARYHLKLSVAFFVIFLFLNSAYYLMLLRFDIKKALSNTQTGKMLTTFLCITKLLVCTCILIALPLMMHPFHECISFLKQDTFFSQNTDFRYINFYDLSEKTTNEDLVEFAYNRLFMLTQFYQDHKEQAVVLQYETTISGYTVIQMNSTALDLVRDNLVVNNPLFNLDSIIQKQKQILLVPLCLPKGVRTEYIQQNNIDPNIRFFEYEQFQTVCIGSDQNYISSYEINPIVILNDFNSDSSYILYRVSDSEIEQFLEKQESKWKYTAVSASELYEIYREKNVKTAVVFMALIIALIIITVMTVFSTIQLYFSSHKMEMAIRYCHGYHWTRLLAVPIFINGIILFLSSACAFLLSVSLNIDVSKFYWCGILLIMLTDLFTVVLVYHRFIKKSIHQIVKGRTV